MLVDMKKQKVKFEIMAKTNEQYISVKNGCIVFLNNFRLLSSG